MPLTLVGIVYYTDDPPSDGQTHHRKGEIFRVVVPEFDDSELDEPPTDGERRRYHVDADGETRRHHPHEVPEGSKPHSWMTLGVDPNRKVVMEKVPRDDPRFAGFMGSLGGAFSAGK